MGSRAGNRPWLREWPSLRGRRRHPAESGDDFRLKPRLHHTRNRKFEPISLQRGVCKLSVPRALPRSKCPPDGPFKLLFVITCFVPAPVEPVHQTSGQLGTTSCGIPRVTVTSEAIPVLPVAHPAMI